MVKTPAATTSCVKREPSEGEERSGIFGLSRCDAAGWAHSQVDGGGGYVESRAVEMFMLPD
jgi:hypothetical protein